MIENFTSGLVVRLVEPITYKHPTTRRTRTLPVGTVLVIAETFRTSHRAGYTVTTDGAYVAIMGCEARHI